MKFIKKFTLALLFFATFKVAAQLPMGDMGRIQKELDNIGGKITPKEASALVDKLFKEKVLNQTGRDILKGYILDKKELALFEKKPKSDTAQADGRAAMLKGMFKSADSLVMNRASLLFILGIIDLHRSTYETARIMKVPLDKMKPILGEKWSFKPILDGDIQNPFSFKINMNEYRDGYNELLESVNRTGLLDPKVYADCQQWMKREQVFIIKDFSLFLYAGLRSLYYDSYVSLKNSQGLKIDSLQLAGLLTKDAASQLKSGIKDFKLLNKTDIFKQIPNTVTLRTSSATGFPQKKEALQRLFEQAPKLIPNLKVSNLEIKEVAMTDEPAMNGMMGALMGGIGKFLDKSLVEVSANLNGKRYVKQIPLNQISEEALPDTSMRNTLGKLLSSVWLGAKDLQILNDFLIDSGSKKRLFVAGDELSVFPSPNREKRVVMLLDSAQQVVLKEQFKFGIGIGFGEGVDFEGTNSFNSLKKIYDEILETKLTNPLNDAQVERVIIESRKSTSRDEVEDNIIFELLNQQNRFVKGNLYDKEQKVGAYKEFLGKMKSVSNNNFNPTEIKDNFETEFAKPKEESKLLKFSFKIGENVFEDSLSINNTGEDNDFAAMLGLSPYSELESKIGGLIYKSMADATVKPYSFSKGKEKHYIFLKDDEFTILADRFIGKFSSTEVYGNTAYADTASAYAGSFNSEQFVQELIEMGMMDEAGKTALNEAVPDGVYSSMETLPYLKERIEFDVINYYKKTEKEFLTDLYQKTRERFFNDLKFDYFRIKKDSIKIEEAGEVYYNPYTAVEYGLGGNKYRDRFYGVQGIFDSIKYFLEQGGSPDSLYSDYVPVPNGFFNAYLMDSDNPKRVFPYVTNSRKVQILAFTDEQAQKVEQYIFGSANRNALLEDIKQLEAQKLIMPITDIDDFLMKYRENTNSLNVLDELYIANPNVFSVFSNDTDKSWKDAIEKITNKAVVLDKFTSNHAEMTKKMEAQYEIEDPAKQAASIDYKAEFMLKGKKIAFNTKLEKDGGYYFDVYKFDELVIKPINAQLDAAKSQKKFYLSDNYLFFITKTQKDFLAEKGVSFNE
jgi:hypothetical protein